MQVIVKGDTAEQLNSWILTGARVAKGPLAAETVDIEIRSGMIAAMRRPIDPGPGRSRLDLRGCLVLPGLINAHDHLEFNLFPRLGRGPYLNAALWGRDIYHPEQSPVREHLLVPLETRLRWGGVKNLLSGVTTVCHHNPYHSEVFSRNFPVRVPPEYGWAHSLEFTPDLPSRFKTTPPDWPFFVHLGEATDDAGRMELGRLNELKALDRRTVLVHGVALRRREMELAHQAGASLVWCPSSNVFILGRTLDQSAFESGIPIALGTDSALSATGDLLSEIRCAHSVSRIPPARLYEMVTSEPAAITRLRNGEGRVFDGGAADLLVVQDRGRSPASTLLELSNADIQMVFVGGKMRLASQQRFGALPPEVRDTLQPLVLGGGTRRRVFIAADVDKMLHEVEPILGAVFLAHRRILGAA